MARSLEKGVTAKVGIPFSLYRFCVQLLESRCLTEMEVRDLAVHHSVLLDIFKNEEGDGKNPGLSAQHTARRAALVDAVNRGGSLVIKFPSGSTSDKSRYYEGNPRTVQWVPDMLTPECLDRMLSSRKLVQDFAITAGDQSACADTADTTSEVSLSSLKRKGKESGTIQKRARLKQTTLVKTPSGVGKPVSASSKGVPTLKAVASTSKTPPAATNKTADALRRRLETKVSGIQTK